MNPKTEMGPLITPAHMEQVLGYIETGKREGAEMICGGNRLTKGELAAGNFVAPTVFVKTKPSMKIVREEIFGPVLVVQLFETEEEAIRLANDTIYGLAGGVFTSDGGKGLRVLKQAARRHHVAEHVPPDIQRGAVGRLQAIGDRTRAWAHSVSTPTWR